MTAPFSRQRRKGWHTPPERRTETNRAAVMLFAEDRDVLTLPWHRVSDGDNVFALEIVESPGHTSGHISVLDSESSVLVTGDALNGRDPLTGSIEEPYVGEVAGPDPQFSLDMDTAVVSAKKLARLEYDAALFAHGVPILTKASAAVAALAKEL